LRIKTYPVKYVIDAPSITKIRLESHSPTTFRNETTFSGCVIPDMPRPNAKRTPDKNIINRLIK
jgi:hypothetical protein